MKAFHFDPKIFRPLKAWHAEGKIPVHFKHLQLLCKQGTFPAVMVCGRWYTSQAWIDSFFGGKGGKLNAAARELLQAESEVTA